MYVKCYFCLFINKSNKFFRILYCKYESSIVSIVIYKKYFTTTYVMRLFCRHLI